jgi:predicted ATPase
LVGPPGIGKTTLALAVAAKVQHFYADGVVFVALAAISDSVLMASTIASAVGSSDTSPKPPKIKLIEFLRRKTLLLALDNLEQIGDAGSLIAELVGECPGLTILATSRERLHLRAEQRFKVPPLALAPALELFTQRAQAVDADFSLTPHNEPTIEAICQRLDCLPLALELCAAQIDLLAPTQLLAHLQDRRLDLLVEGAHDLPPRQRTLRTAIGYSYRLLDEEERILFRSLGVFVGGFDLPALEMVNAWRQETGIRPLRSMLHALIGKSLVRAETLPSGEQRFLLLETIREYALEQLRMHGEEALLRQRHYATYLHLFRTGDSYLRRAEAATWLARLEPEQDNLRAALQWALDAARYEDVTWLMHAALWFWRMRGHWGENNRWLAQLVPHRQLLDTDLRLTVLMNVYSAAEAWEEFQPIDRWSDELMQLLAVCSDKSLQAAAWFFIARFSTDFSPAAWERAIALARAAQEGPGLGAEFGALADCDFRLACCLEDYANALLEQGEVTQAAPLITESLEIYRRWGNRYEMADGPGTLGLVALLQGDLAQAHRLLHEAVTIATDFKNQGMLGTWQPLLGIVTLYSGDSAEAHRLLSESLRICLDLKAKDALARVCTYLAEVALWTGELDETEHWLAQSLAYHSNSQRITIYDVERLFVTARLATVQQHYQRAAMIFGLADQAHSRIHYAIDGPMRALADAALATVREALDPETFVEAFATGQQLSLEEAFATILAPSHVVSAPTKG